MRFTASSTALIVTTLLAGCAVGPAYAPPQLDLPPTFSQGAGLTHDDADWWTAFGDPELTALVERALEANIDIRQAAVRVREARQQEAMIRGAQGPQINASAQATTARLSKNALPSSLAGLLSGGGGPSSSGGLGLPGETFTTYQAGFDASWELDLFGGQRRADEGAHARVEAAIWSQRDAQVQLAAEVAAAYFQYRALQRRLALADDTLRDQKEALAFLKVRAANGLISDTDTSRQSRAVAQAGAQRDDLTAQADTRRHALAVLLGLPPAALDPELASSPPAPPRVIDVPPGLPAELIRRRPDVRAAERKAAAANADVGVAVSDLYPKVTLTGALQLASRSLSSLVDGDSVQDNAAGKLSLPLLGRARLRANVGLREAQSDEAALAYRKTAILALRDVEDALSRLAADRRRLDQANIAAAAAKEEADTAGVQARNGLITAAESLAAQVAWRSAQDSQVQLEAQAAQDMASLYKALGGGWNDRAMQEDKARGQGS